MVKLSLMKAILAVPCKGKQEYVADLSKMPKGKVPCFATWGHADCG